MKLIRLTWAVLSIAACGSPNEDPYAKVTERHANAASIENDQPTKSWNGVRLAEPLSLTMEREIEFESTSLNSPERSSSDSEIVLSDSVLVVVDYPIDGTWVFPLEAPVPGWSRFALVREISDLYKFIYAEESRTTRAPEGRAGTLLNRNETNGTYGVWGHDIKDLVLEGMELSKGSDGKKYLVLSIGS